MGILANGLFFVTLAVGFWVDRLGFPVGERNGGGALHRRGERVCTQHAQTETVIGHCRLTSGADRLGTEQRWQRRTNWLLVDFLLRLLHGCFWFVCYLLLKFCSLLASGTTHFSGRVICNMSCVFMGAYSAPSIVTCNQSCIVSVLFSSTNKVLWDDPLSAGHCRPLLTVVAQLVRFTPLGAWRGNMCSICPWENYLKKPQQTSVILKDDIDLRDMTLVSGYFWVMIKWDIWKELVIKDYGFGWRDIWFDWWLFGSNYAMGSIFVIGWKCCASRKAKLC